MLRKVLENSRHSKPSGAVYLMQILRFEGNIGYEYRYPLARHLHSSRDACACIGTRKDAGGARRRAFAQIYNPTSKRASERAEGVVREWVMIHSPACEAFRDRRIRRDPETAEPSGSSEREQNVARRVSSIEPSPPWVLSAWCRCGSSCTLSSSSLSCCFAGLSTTLRGHPVAQHDIRLTMLIKSARLSLSLIEKRLMMKILPRENILFSPPRTS